MITIISATNRLKSNTLIVAEKYKELVDLKGVECNLFSFEELPKDFIFTDLFDLRSVKFQQILDKYIIPVKKLVIICP